MFFPVGLLKLALMSLVTLGLYEVYWFYKNWQCVQRLNNEKLSAAIRALFYPVTAYFLFRRIRDHGTTIEGGVPLQAGLLALAVFILIALSRLRDPFWLASLFAFLPLLPVQSLVNAINGRAAPDADPNRRFQPWNIVALVVGGLFLILAVVGAFFG